MNKTDPVWDAIGPALLASTFTLSLLRCCKDSGISQLYVLDKHFENILGFHLIPLLALRFPKER